MTIGERIKIRREELDMSQDELAQAIGYKSRSSINKIESDERNLTQSKIKKIADALYTTPSYIMGWDDTSADTIKKSLTDDEDALITKYRTLDIEDRHEVVSFVDFKLSGRKYRA